MESADSTKCAAPPHLKRSIAMGNSNSVSLAALQTPAFQAPVSVVSIAPTLVSRSARSCNVSIAGAKLPLAVGVGSRLTCMPNNLTTHSLRTRSCTVLAFVGLSHNAHQQVLEEPAKFGLIKKTRIFLMASFP